MAILPEKVESEMDQIEPGLRDVRPVRARFQTEVRRFARARERKLPAKGK